MKKNSFKTFSVLAVFLIFAAPVSVKAAKIFIDQPEKMTADNTYLIKVALDTEGKEINVAEGILRFDKSSEIISINTGGSIFDLWPRKPSLASGKISFTGGTTAGVYGPNLKLFSIAVKPTKPEIIKISFEDAAVYLNDGKGTKIIAASSPLEIKVLPAQKKDNELVSLINEDKNPPAPFKIDLGRESSVYEGKYFISFYATDKESGVQRYEVKENNLPMVRSGNVYILQNQELSGQVEVKAIDNAGNIRSQMINLEEEKNQSGSPVNVLIVAIVLIVVTAMFFVFKKNKGK